MGDKVQEGNGNVSKKTVGKSTTETGSISENPENNEGDTRKDKVEELRDMGKYGTAGDGTKSSPPGESSGGDDKKPVGDMTDNSKAGESKAAENEGADNEAVDNKAANTSVNAEENKGNSSKSLQRENDGKVGNKPSDAAPANECDDGRDRGKSKLGKEECEEGSWDEGDPDLDMDVNKPWVKPSVDAAKAYRKVGVCKQYAKWVADGDEVNWLLNRRKVPRCTGGTLKSRRLASVLKSMVRHSFGTDRLITIFKRCYLQPTTVVLAFLNMKIYALKSGDSRWCSMRHLLVDGKQAG